MKIEEISDCTYPFGKYLKELTDDIIVILDENLKLLKSNDRFLELSKLEKGEIKGKKIDELIISEGSDFPALSEKNTHEVLNLQLSDLFSTKGDYFFTCYIFKKGNRYYLIGEEKQVEDKLAKKNKKLEKAKEKIEKLSKTDELTGLPNRRHFMDYLEKMISQARRHSNPLSLAMIDLDKFKDINDTYGHNAGDDVLSALGALLKEETRKEDLAGRIGGEEFCLILTQTDTEKAYNFAERIRKKINQLEIDSVSTEISASLGVSSMKNGDDSEALLKRADAALYKAKEGGRNKVCPPA